MTEQHTSPETCTHPQKGRQERLAGMGTGDYHCTECRTPMPVSEKAPKCSKCGVDYEVDPVHGAAWRCPSCRDYWGWVRRAPSRS